VRSSPVRPLLVAFLLVASVVPSFAQQTGTVSGTVVVTESGAPLAGASVVIVARPGACSQREGPVSPDRASRRAQRARPADRYEAAEQRVVVPRGKRSPSISSSPPRRSPSTNRRDRRAHVAYGG